MNIIDIDDLSPEAIQHIWAEAQPTSIPTLNGNVGWSFEGNGIRTRTTFVQAFQQLKLAYVELPNFLKTKEHATDLAGYMDPFYSLYVIRENNHERLLEFAQATNKPVINAMSSQAHPCEVLTDGYFLANMFPDIQQARILLWGPTTNVFRSWHALARVMKLNLTHYCPATHHADNAPYSHPIQYTDALSGEYDLLITDAWPSGFSDAQFCLNETLLSELGNPILLPTPPVTLGNELSFLPSSYSNFAGYQQKAALLDVQMSIIAHLLNQY